MIVVETHGRLKRQLKKTGGVGEGSGLGVGGGGQYKTSRKFSVFRLFFKQQTDSYLTVHLGDNQSMSHSHFISFIAFL